MSMKSFVVAFAILAGACGGGSAQNEAKSPETPAAATTAPAPGSDAAAVAPGGGAPAKPWKEMSLSEKKTHMKTVVMPKMGAVFQSFDKAKYADFSCTTCHGARARNGNFTMPNPDLPKLNAAGGFKKHMDKAPELTKFMMQHVEPEMAAALGLAPYDPATHQGFGCGGCHVFEQ